MNGSFKDNFMKGIFFITAITSILAVALIFVFIFVNGIPAISEIGLINFITGKEWSPTDIPPSFGIFPMIVGSIYITLGAVLIGVTIGILTAIFLALTCPKNLYTIIKPAINLIAGIPSVVFGFFGMMLLVPIIGSNIITASIILGIMILPTVIGLSESAINAVPVQYYEGAVALGAGHYRSIFFAVLPAAKSGIFAAIVLGVGRAMGETMAVIMVAGNQARVPSSIFQGARTLTANIVLEMGYATDLHRGALIGTGVILFIFILIINIIFFTIKGRN